MDLDFEKSLTYIAKDPQWGNKLLAGAGLILAMIAVFLFPLLMLLTGLIPVVAVTFVLALICAFLLWFAVTGYVCKTVYIRINEPENGILPDWKNFGELIITGIKYFCGYFLYILPVILISSVFWGFFIVGCARTHLPMFASDAIYFIFVVLLGAFALFLTILTSIFLPLMMANFFKEQKILSFVALKDAFSMLKNNVGNYCILILLYIALSMLNQIVCSVLVATIVGIIFIPIFYFYVYLVVADLNAQFVEVAKNKQITADNPQENANQENA